MNSKTDIGNQLSNTQQTFIPFLLNHSYSKKNLHLTTSTSNEPTWADELDNPSIAFDADGLIRTKYEAYSARIDYLRTCAKDDSFALNEESEVDFWCFVNSVPHFRKGNLVLIDNGNLRAEWQDKFEKHLGLQFLGNGMLQYVILSRRTDSQQISRVSGRDTFDGVKRQIAVFDLDTMLNESSLEYNKVLQNNWLMLCQKFQPKFTSTLGPSLMFDE